MQPERREALEREIRAHWDAADLQSAADAAMRGYGPEIFGFLLAFHRHRDDASEVYAAFTERLWHGLPGFEWQCSFRTWAYAIARNTSISYRRNKRRHAELHAPMPDGSQLSILERAPRSDTASFLKTQRKARIAALRESLPREDQELLVLRVDRQLAYGELARILLHAEDGTPATDEALRREAARLRKRFQVIKQQLYELGKREGLIDERDG